MESSVYNNLGFRKNLKQKNHFLEKKVSELFTIKDFIDHKFIVTSKEEFRSALYQSIKLLLEKENVFDLITDFFELEQHLQQAMDIVDFEIDQFHFDEFYKNLSPIILRSIVENSHNSQQAPILLKSIKESIRLALEEELCQIEESKI